MSGRRLRSASQAVERVERSPRSAFRGLDTIVGVEAAIATVAQRIESNGRKREHALACIAVERDREERTVLKSRASQLAAAIAEDELILGALRDRLRLLKRNAEIVARGGTPFRLPEFA